MVEPETPIQDTFRYDENDFVLSTFETNQKTKIATILR
jgi:hypothetical protein